MIIWYMLSECDKQNFFSFSTIFCPFTPQITHKMIHSDIFWYKMKQYDFYTCEIFTPGDFYTCVPQMKIIWFCVCWNIRHNEHNVLSSWAIFALYPPNNPENQSFEKKKMPRVYYLVYHLVLSCIRAYHLVSSCIRVYHLASCYIFLSYMTIIWFTVPEIWSATDKSFCHFGPFFVLLPRNNQENQNFEKTKTKTKRNACRYHHTCVP